MRRGGSVSGAVSLVMIFCVLCLVVFTVLTLSTAVRERQLSELTAERAGAYYEADAKAVETVAALRRGETFPEVRITPEDGATLAEFAIPAGGDQSLEVAVRLTDTDCEILRWQTVYTGSWEVDDRIEVWGGN